MPQNQKRETGEEGRGEPGGSVGTNCLCQNEVHPFLNFIFGDIARRPGALDIHRAARVVRFLRLVSIHGVLTAAAECDRSTGTMELLEESAPQRAFVTGFAGAIWNKLLVFGNVRPCSRAAVKAFLTKHARTYFAELDIAGALKILDRLHMPESVPEDLVQPTLMSGSLRAEGGGSSHFRDDVSERIYAAFYALKAAKVNRRLHLLANTLDKLGVESRTAWTYKVVNDRLRRFRRHLHRRFERQAEAAQVERLVGEWSTALANRWILTFRMWREFENQI